MSSSAAPFVSSTSEMKPKSGPVVKHPAQVARRNARERNRVRQVNQGFVTLRNHVPAGTKNKKLSKVETLRQAVRYIQQLQEVLVNTGDANNPGFTMPPPCYPADFDLADTQPFNGQIQFSENYNPQQNFFGGYPTQTSYPPMPEPRNFVDFAQGFAPKSSPATSDPSPSSSYLSDSSSFEQTASPQQYYSVKQEFTPSFS